MTDSADGKKIVLSIDDMPSNLIAIKNILGHMFDVRLVKDGDQALALLKREKIDLILLDIEMPGYTGFDLLKIIQQDKDLAAIPVVFVTTHATPSFIQRAAAADAKGYILKPFKPSVLLQKVLELLDMDEPTAHQNNICPL
jgi:CheY-like chemotaxis protein